MLFYLKMKNIAVWIFLMPRRCRDYVLAHETVLFRHFWSENFKTRYTSQRHPRVMASSKKTYMLQSLIYSPKLQCAYQIFYSVNVYRYGLKPKYDMVSLLKDGSFLNNPLYVWDVVNSTIYLSSNPGFRKDPTQLELLYSDFKTCIVTKGPHIKDFPRACRLWLTDSSFASPKPLCTNKFRRHCKYPPYPYNIEGCVDLDKHY
uniref:Putative salivary lipocalin n=1 Tax=Ixodes ricinus TaxID=34613 RepID=A0A0K8R3G8_IXORI